MTKRKLAPQNGFGTITFEDGRKVAVKDARIAAALDDNDRRLTAATAELADYRACYGPVKAALMRLEGHWWTRLGRWLGLAVQRWQAPDADSAITMREFRASEGALLRGWHDMQRQRVSDMAPQREKAERERTALRVTGGATDGRPA